MSEATELFERYPMLRSVRPEIERAYALLENVYLRGGKLMVCGNGGSAADSEHIVGELMKGFKKKRRLPPERRAAFEALGDEGRALADGLQGGLRAASLAYTGALNTAFANDEAPALIFAQQVYVWAETGRDALLALSTSGNAENVVNAALTAKARGIPVVGITGAGGGRLAALCDVCICLPERETCRVQELTLPVYHALCAMLEERFFDE